MDLMIVLFIWIHQLSWNVLISADLECNLVNINYYSTWMWEIFQLIECLRFDSPANCKIIFQLFRGNLFSRFSFDSEKIFNETNWRLIIGMFLLFLFDILPLFCTRCWVESNILTLVFVHWKEKVEELTKGAVFLKDPHYKRNSETRRRVTVLEEVDSVSNKVKVPICKMLIFKQRFQSIKFSTNPLKSTSTRLNLSPPIISSIFW